MKRAIVTTALVLAGHGTSASAQGRCEEILASALPPVTPDSAFMEPRDFGNRRGQLALQLAYRCDEPSEKTLADLEELRDYQATSDSLFDFGIFEALPRGQLGPMQFSLEWIDAWKAQNCGIISEAVKDAYQRCVDGVPQEESMEFYGPSGN